MLRVHQLALKSATAAATLTSRAQAGSRLFCDSLLARQIWAVPSASAWNLSATAGSDQSARSSRVPLASGKGLECSSLYNKADSIKLIWMRTCVAAGLGLSYFYSALDYPSNSVHCDTQLGAKLPPVVLEDSSIFVEPKSSTKFPKRLYGCSLVSAGVRAMTPLKIQVYALGLYLDTIQMSRIDTIRQNAGKSGEELMSNNEFWAAVTNPDLSTQRVIRMEVVRQVNGSHMQNGFDRALIPRVRKAAKNGMPGGKEALRTFNKCFLEKNQMPVGTIIEFMIQPGGTMQVVIDGSQYAVIESPALCWSVLDMFFGPKPVSWDTKASVANGFSEILASEK